MPKKTNTEILVELLPKWQKSPILFIKDMWNFIPQPIKPEYKTAVNILLEDLDFDQIKAEFFEPFQKGLHITWQQWIILLSIEAGIANKKPKRISVASAHGIGKSCSISWILIWYLFCHRNAQIACTAPTSKQLFDVLWKEISKWISRLPGGWQPKFEWQSTYIRMTEAPQEWFASAKTARKESTEALAGVHGDHVMVIADEASGVNNETFDTMEGSLTEEDILVILISNPTRLSGYFYDTQKTPEIAKMWQNLQFSNIDSPVVKDNYADYIIKKHGMDSDEYRIRVLGEFPKADAVDDQGYSSLMHQDQIKEIDHPTQSQHNNNQQQPIKWIGDPVMGVDPAGEGNDETRWVIRDQFKAAVVGKEKTSTPLSIARKTRTLMMLHKVKPENVWVDSFGVGSDTATELAKGNHDINPLNVGNACENDEDKKLYLNRRAQNFMRMKKWLRSGGELYRDPAWKKEIPSIRFRRNASEKIQIMSKREMKKNGYQSPNTADALMLTFSEELNPAQIKTFTKEQRTAYLNPTITRNTKNNLYSAI